MAKTYSAGGIAHGAKYWRLTVDVRENDGERRRLTKTTKIACAKNGTRDRSAALIALRQWRGEICALRWQNWDEDRQMLLVRTRSRRAKTAASSFATTRKTPPGEAPSETSPCPRRWRPRSPPPSAPRWTGSATSTARSTFCAPSPPICRRLTRAADAAASRSGIPRPGLWQRAPLRCQQIRASKGPVVGNRKLKYLTISPTVAESRVGYSRPLSVDEAAA